MADLTRKNRGSVEEKQNINERCQQQPLRSSLSGGSTTNNIFDSMPTEVLELLLQAACVACCSDLKNEPERVFQELSDVCRRWCDIISSELFRATTIEKLIRCGLSHRYYKKPQCMLVGFQGTMQRRYYALDDDFYSPGCIAFANSPFQLDQYKRVAEPNSAAEACSARKSRPEIMVQDYCLQETFHIRLPTPSGISQNGYVLSRKLCRRNRSMYLGYYNTRDVIDNQTHYVIARLSPNVWKDDSALRGWPIKSDNAVAWTLPPHSVEFTLGDTCKCYDMCVSDRTGNVMVIDNLKRRLIVYDENGNALAVVLMPQDVGGIISDVVEIVTREDERQYMLRHETTSEATSQLQSAPAPSKICRIVVDRTTQSVSEDVISCPQYMAKVVARYVDLHYSTYGACLVDMDDDGLVVLALESRCLKRRHRLMILRPSDLRPIGSPIELPFSWDFGGYDVDCRKGRINFFVPSNMAPVPLYCCTVRPGVRIVSN